MDSALVSVAELITIFVAIALLTLTGRKELWRAIMLLSLIAIIGAVVNLILWVLQVNHSVPSSSTSTITPVDTIRVFAAGSAYYFALAAWIFSLLIAVQQRHTIWALILTCVGVFCVVSLYVVDHPYAFIARSEYTRLDAILLDLFAHVIPVLTLIFSVLTRPMKKAELSSQMPLYMPASPTGTE